MKITKSKVDELEFTPGRSNQQIYWDDEQPGFGVRVTATSKSYVCESRVNGKTRRITIGRHGKLTAEQARQLARREVGKLASGIDPSVEKAKNRERGITLQMALDAYLEGKNGKLKPRTVSDYKLAMVETFSDWMKRPIQSFTVANLRSRYSKRVKESPARANNAMRVLRAVLRDAAAEVQDKAAKADLQDLVREALHKRWAKVERRDTLITRDDLPNWVNAVLNHKNSHHLSKAGVVADYLMFNILTGCRREEAATMLWDDVNFKAKTFTLRDTKNRGDHTLPMTDWLEDMFVRRKKTATNDFVFQGDGKTGHLVEPKKQMVHIIKASKVHFTIHDLRRTFASLAEGLGIGTYTLKRLMNHKMSGDVTAGYVILNTENLREPMQKITDFVLRAGNMKTGAQVVQLHRKES
jgi:integrase